MKTSTRIAIIVVAGAAVVGGVFLYKTQWSEAQKEQRSGFQLGKPDERPAPTPKGSFEVKIERSSLPQSPVAGISDKGDVLLVASKEAGEYDLHQGGKVQHMKTPALNVRYYLTPAGTAIQLADEPITSGTSPNIFPYNESADRFKFFGDGTLAIVRKDAAMTESERKSKGLPAETKKRLFEGDFYTFTRESLKPTDGDAPAANGGRGGTTQEPNSPNKALGGIPKGYFNALVKGTQLYAAKQVLTVLATDEHDTAWISARTGSASKGTDKLFKFNGAAHEEVPMPEGYSNVHRIAATNGTVAGTFGILNGKLPFRSFIADGKSWKELPIPSGYECSFVQQVFNDGVILGYVTSWDGKNMKNVLWKGDSLVILNDVQGWPKNGELTLVNRSNHTGMVAVRNIQDQATGNSDYYLLSLKY